MESSIFHRDFGNGLNTIKIFSKITSTGADESLFQGIFNNNLPIWLDYSSKGNSKSAITSGLRATFSITTLPLHIPNLRLASSNPVMNFPK